MYLPALGNHSRYMSFVSGKNRYVLQSSFLQFNLKRTEESKPSHTEIIK